MDQNQNIIMGLLSIIKKQKLKDQERKVLLLRPRQRWEVHHCQATGNSCGGEA